MLSHPLCTALGLSAFAAKECPFIASCQALQNGAKSSILEGSGAWYTLGALPCTLNNSTLVVCLYLRLSSGSKELYGAFAEHTLIDAALTVWHA